MAGLCEVNLRKSGSRWTAQTDLGEITIDLVPHNDLGVADHRVTLADGTSVNNLLRVLENGDGSEVVFTLYLIPDAGQNARRI